METTIGWTGTPNKGLMLKGYTFNPWWGCVKVSPACKHCYAETLSKRWGFDVWGKDAERRKQSDKYWNEPLKWNKLAGQLGIRQKVFSASMADWAEDNPEVVEERAKLFKLIKATPNLNWLLLTKRCDENLINMLPDDWGNKGYPNVWLGTTCENQEEANKRIPYLLQTPAIIHFVSAEPLLGYINFEQIEVSSKQLGFVFPGAEDHVTKMNSLSAESSDFGHGIDWVIAGGESGDKARPMHYLWAAYIRDQCANYKDVEFFFKQWGQYQEGSNVEKHKEKGRHVVILDNGDYAERDEWVSFQKKYNSDMWNKMNAQVMAKVTVKKAGRSLDGITHDQMPIWYDQIK